MNRLTILVSPEGRWVFPGSSEFLDLLGDPDPDYDAEAFAVKNMGFLKFTMIERAIIEIELHPRTVEASALLAVQQQILTSGINLFRIKYLTTEWKSEITSSAEQTVLRLSELCTPELNASAKARYIIEERDLSELANDEENPLRGLTQKWRTAFRRFDKSVLDYAIDHGMLPQLLIIGLKPDGTDPVWKYVGEAHSSWLDRRHHLNLIGDRVEHVPDKDYGGWAAEFYKNVAGTGQPRFDCVTALIQGGARPYRTRYERLVLPWRTASDEVFLTVSPRRLVEKAADPISAPAVGGDSNSLLRKAARSS